MSLLTRAGYRSTRGGTHLDTTELYSTSYSAWTSPGLRSTRISRDTRLPTVARSQPRSASPPHVTAFEVGARGVVTKDNSDRLKALHKFCQKKIKYKQFLQNILALAVNASYYLWICRKDPVWSDPPLLTTPFSTHQWHTTPTTVARCSATHGLRGLCRPHFSSDFYASIIQYNNVIRQGTLMSPVWNGDGAWEKSSCFATSSFSLAWGCFYLTRLRQIKINTHNKSCSAIILLALIITVSSTINQLIIPFLAGKQLYEL